MSNSTSMLNKKKSKKIVLNGRFKAYNDTTGYNSLQLLHYAGVLDLYKDLPQANGEILPSVSEQWKEDYRKRFLNGKSSRNR